MFNLIYAELLNADGIVDKVVCSSMDEFISYRKRGYTGTRAHDQSADAAIAAECTRFFEPSGLPNRSPFWFLARLRDGSYKMACVIKSNLGGYTVGGVKYADIQEWAKVV